MNAIATLNENKIMQIEFDRCCSSSLSRAVARCVRSSSSIYTWQRLYDCHVILEIPPKYIIVSLRLCVYSIAREWERERVLRLATCVHLAINNSQWWGKTLLRAITMGPHIYNKLAWNRCNCAIINKHSPRGYLRLFFFLFTFFTCCGGIRRQVYNICLRLLKMKII